jgi:hypothetical protein
MAKIFHRKTLKKLPKTTKINDLKAERGTRKAEMDL